MTPRLLRLWRLMEEQGIAALLVSNPVNISYLTGFAGSYGYLLVAAGNAWLVTDSRYLEQARLQAPLLEVLDAGQSAWAVLKDLLAGFGFRELAVEADYLTVENLRRLQEALAGLVELRPVPSPVAVQRRVKEAAEVAAVEAAVSLADEAFTHILGYLAPGRRERDVALELEFYMRRRGAEGVPFQFIVASGERSALPHGTAGDRELAAGDTLVLDFGCILEGYCSDLSRTVFLGGVDPLQRRVYEAVLAAQEKALAGIQAGLSGRDADALARTVLADAGFAGYFGHGLGHGLGREVHEAPRLSPFSSDVLEQDMVVTVEPGVYLAGRFGVRIEDVVVVGRHGCRVLTKSSKQLTCL